MRILVLGIALFAMNGCISVQTKLTADIIVESPRGHDHYTYESWDSHNVAPLAIGCVITAWFYGGACWAYLAAPFDDQEVAAIEAARRDLATLGCARLASSRVDKVGYEARHRSARITNMRAQVFSMEDARRLCGAQMPEGVAPPSPTGPAQPTGPAPPPSTPAAPPPPSPPVKRPPVFDPAEP